MSIKNVDNEELKCFLEELQEDEFTEEGKEILVSLATKKDSHYLRCDMTMLNCLYGTDYIMYNLPNQRMEIYDRVIGRIDIYIPSEAMSGSHAKEKYDFCKLIAEDLKKNFPEKWYAIDTRNDEWEREVYNNPYSLEPTMWCRKTGITIEGDKKIEKIIEDSLPSIDLMGDNPRPFNYLTIVEAIKKSLFKKFNLFVSKELEEKQAGYYDNI